MMSISHGAAAAIVTISYAKLARRDDLLTRKVIGGMFFFGVLPDIPLTALVLTGKFDPAVHFHHRWITHTPIFWLALSLIIMKFISPRAGYMLLLGTWLHLGMDWYGGADGIPFLFPITNQQFGVGLTRLNGADGFYKYIQSPLFLGIEAGILGTFSCLVINLKRKSKQRANVIAPSGR